jgi:hypothetical protein
MFRPARVSAAIAAVLFVGACSSPTDPDDDTPTIRVEDFIEGVANPTNAAPSSGKTYRVVRGNNQPDEIREYQWKAPLTVTLTINDKAKDDDIDENGLEFPVKIALVTVLVEQATGGIVTPPTGDSVYSEFVLTHASGNQFDAANTSLQLDFDVWYSLPNQLRESLITVTFTFEDSDFDLDSNDDDGIVQRFQLAVKGRVAP